MQAFKFRGYGPDGESVQGEVLAPSIEDAERRIVAQDVTVVAILPGSMRKGPLSVAEMREGKTRRALSDAEAATILHNLALMAETGVPFVEALETVALGVKNPRTAAALDAIKAEIVAGHSLSQAMRTVGGLFPPLVADMVRVAEEGGRLDRTLRSAAGYLERSADLRRRVMNAMLYPIVMLSISVMTLLILVVVVVPRFANVFDRMGAEVPALTKAMLVAGDVLRGHPFLSVGGLVVMALALRYIATNPKLSEIAYRRVLLKTPMLGDLLRKLSFSRAFYSVATLLSGNVPMISALEHGAKVAGNPEVANALMSARVAVEHGRTFSEALGETGVFPATLLQMVAVGERTGRLATLLGTSAESLEREVDGRLKALVAIVEPVMIVLMGVVVGGITLSIIGPIYSVVQNIK